MKMLGDVCMNLNKFGLWRVCAWLFLFRSLGFRIRINKYLISLNPGLHYETLKACFFNPIVCNVGDSRHTQHFENVRYRI